MKTRSYEWSRKYSSIYTTNSTITISIYDLCPHLVITSDNFVSRNIPRFNYFLCYRKSLLFALYLSKNVPRMSAACNWSIRCIDIIKNLLYSSEQKLRNTAFVFGISKNTLPRPFVTHL